MKDEMTVSSWSTLLQKLQFLVKFKNKTACLKMSWGNLVNLPQIWQNTYKYCKADYIIPIYSQLCNIKIHTVTWVKEHLSLVKT